MKNKILRINLDLKLGSYDKTVWSSDLTKDYIEINAGYRSQLLIMETFSKILDQFLIEINESINDKISGINLLELLKFGLIEKFKDLDENVLKDLKLISLNKKILENEIDLNNRKITYKIEYFDKPTSKIKHKYCYYN